jgi:hypothetical protein
MATFKDWALQYVLADDDAVLGDIAAKAARGKLFITSMWQHTPFT